MRNGFSTTEVYGFSLGSDIVQDPKRERGEGTSKDICSQSILNAFIFIANPPL